jgi:cytoskeletal protein CcmA (bactofilin family)
MHLAPDTRFFRLGAPLLLCGEDLTPHRDSPPETVVITHQELENVTCTAGERVLVEGDLEIPAGRCFHGDLVVKGTLRFGAGAHLVGSAKADHLHMGRGARVDGALVAREELRLEEGVSVHGPALCEGDFHIAARCEVGSLEHPSTLRARRLTIDAPCRLHGSVWAQEEGVLR